MTPEDRDRHTSAGRDALRDVASPLGLWDEFRTGLAREEVRRSVVLRLIRSTRSSLAGHARTFAKNFARGLGGIRAWSAAMLGSIGSGHFAAAMATVGSTALTAVESDVAAARVDRESKYLAKFRAALRSGAEPILQPLRSAGAVATATRQVAARFVARARMYADALFGTGEAAFRERMRSLGVEEEIWLLSVADHCTGCPTQAARGWVRLDADKPLPAIGTQRCRSRCRCSKAWRRPASPWVASPLATARQRAAIVD